MLNPESSIQPPRHVGLIPDGTRRWAEIHSLLYSEAYAYTMKAIAHFVRIMYSEGVLSVSVYLLSKENLLRNSHDLNAVFDAETFLFKELLPQIMEEFNVKVVHAGSESLLPHQYGQALHLLVENTSIHQERKLYLLAAYNPIDEIEVASQRTESECISFNYFWVPEPLDLVIRTSGELRLSNFLPLQSGYAELIFTQQHFNDLSEKDMKNLLQVYMARKRRFGK